MQGIQLLIIEERRSDRFQRRSKSKTSLWTPLIPWCVHSSTILSVGLVIGTRYVVGRQPNATLTLTTIQTSNITRIEIIQRNYEHDFSTISSKELWTRWTNCNVQKKCSNLNVACNFTSVHCSLRCTSKGSKWSQSRWASIKLWSGREGIYTTSEKPDKLAKVGDGREGLKWEDINLNLILTLEGCWDQGADSHEAMAANIKRCYSCEQERWSALPKLGLVRV